MGATATAFVAPQRSSWTITADRGLVASTPPGTVQISPLFIGAHDLGLALKAVGCLVLVNHPVVLTVRAEFVGEAVDDCADVVHVKFAAG